MATATQPRVAGRSPAPTKRGRAAMREASAGAERGHLLPAVLLHFPPRAKTGRRAAARFPSYKRRQVPWISGRRSRATDSRPPAGCRLDLGRKPRCATRRSRGSGSPRCSFCCCCCCGPPGDLAQRATTRRRRKRRRTQVGERRARRRQNSPSTPVGASFRTVSSTCCFDGGCR